MNLLPGAAPTGEGNAAPTLNDPAPDASSDRTQDFGFFRPLSLGDLVWEDVNNDGDRDTGEPAIGGWWSTCSGWTPATPATPAR